MNSSERNKRGKIISGDGEGVQLFRRFWRKDLSKHLTMVHNQSIAEWLRNGSVSPTARGHFRERSYPGHLQTTSARTRSSPRRDHRPRPPRFVYNAIKRQPRLPLKRFLSLRRTREGRLVNSQEALRVVFLGDVIMCNGNVVEWTDWTGRHPLTATKYGDYLNCDTALYIRPKIPEKIAL